MNDITNILIVGAPASGKSTLIKNILIERNNFKSIDIDFFVDKNCVLEEINSAPIPIELIEKSAIELMHFSNINNNYLIELPYHDYLYLINKNILDINQFVKVVFISAELNTILKRNSNRKKNIPENYIINCIDSINIFENYIKNRYCEKYITISSEYKINLEKLKNNHKYFEFK